MRSSNICLEFRLYNRIQLLRCLTLVSALCALAGPALALDPNRAISQYIRDQWSVEQGFPGGSVNAISQTPDGYLWIGSENGLVRFDGVSFVLVRSADAAVSPKGPVRELAADATGDLWIRDQNLTVTRYRDGKFEAPLRDAVQGDRGVTAITRDAQGRVLLLARSFGMLRSNGARLEKLSRTAWVPNLLVISIAETPDGTGWLGTRDAGLFALKSGQLTGVTRGLPDHKVNSLLAVNDRELWVGTDNGVVRWNGTELTSPGNLAGHAQILSMLKDRDSNIWVGSSRGLLRLESSSGHSALSKAPALSIADSVNALFEDREGNLWVGTNRGVERFRDRAFLSYTSPVSRQSAASGPLYDDGDGCIWSAPGDGGLMWRRGSESKRVGGSELDGDVIYSIAGRNDEVWLGRRRGGLTHLDANGKSRTYTRAQGLARDSVYAVYQGTDGTVWAGTIDGGVSKFRNGTFTNYTTADGLASNTITAIAEGRDGSMWFGTPNGISVYSANRWRAYSGQDGLPPGGVNCLFVDSAGVLWIGTPVGPLLFRSNRIETPGQLPVALRSEIVGLAEDQQGGLWVATSTRILRVRREAALRGTIGATDVREYGTSDGLLSTECVKRYRSVISDSLGRVWFSTSRGLSVVDASRLRQEAVPATVRIQEVSADGSEIDGPLRRIPSSRKRIIIRYAGLSLSVPERVRFRYQLEHFDRDWIEPGAAREAVYTNLNPGSYDFRVAASVVDGIWNSEIATVRLVIEPALWQTWWFNLALALAAGLTITALYRLRLRRLTLQLNMRFEERLAERTRIAQELHDTLLQGFISASMQLHVAHECLPSDSPARQSLKRVLELMAQVTREGRNALRGLRSNESDARDLELAFSRIPREFAAQDVQFRVIVMGHQRPLHPLLQDDIYRIGHEAVVNAFRHSQASGIEVELDYEPDQLRLLVRDNGHGIDPHVLDVGRSGHWGLTGMRERAERLGAKLKLSSSTTAGTEVVLSVPGHLAFQSSNSRKARGWLTRVFMPERAKQIPQSNKEQPK